MPPELLSLLRSSRREVCKQILKICKDGAHHCKSLQTLIKGLTRKEWKTFSEMKDRYLLPIHVREEVLSDCLKIWWNDLRNHISGNILEIGDFLIRYFCLTENSHWNYQLRSNNSNIINSLILLNPHMIFLKICCKLSQEEMNILLSRITNITMLSLTVYDDDVYQIIGRNCLKLKQLSISHDNTDFTITVDRAKKLCYKDFPQNTILNSLCNTLDILFATCTPGGSEVILNSFPNIGGLICNFVNIEEAVVDSDYKEIKIEPADLIYTQQFSTTTAKEKLGKLYEDFPALELLNVDGEYCEDLVPNSNFSKLWIEINGRYVRTPRKYKLPPLWTNLSVLSIGFIEDNTAWRIDICGLSNCCPNLKFLQLMNCTEMVGTTSKVFWKLEKLYLHNVVLAKGYNILSKSCKRLKFLWFYDETRTLFENSDFYDDLNSNCYPCLESLYCDPSVEMETSNRIFSFLTQFPRLKSFGSVDNEAMIEEIENKFSAIHRDVRIVDEIEHVDIRNL